MSRKEALSQFINQIHGRPVVVKLNSGVDYRGKYSMNGQKRCMQTSNLADASSVKNQMKKHKIN